MIITDEDPGTVADSWATPIEVAWPWLFLDGIIRAPIEDIIALKLRVEYGIEVAKRA